MPETWVIETSGRRVVEPFFILVSAFFQVHSVLKEEENKLWVQTLFFVMPLHVYTRRCSEF